VRCPAGHPAPARERFWSSLLGLKASSVRQGCAVSPAVGPPRAGSGLRCRSRRSRSAGQTHGHRRAAVSALGPFAGLRAATGGVASPPAGKAGRENSTYVTAVLLLHG